MTLSHALDSYYHSIAYHLRVIGIILIERTKGGALETYWKRRLDRSKSTHRDMFMTVASHIKSVYQKNVAEK